MSRSPSERLPTKDVVSKQRPSRNCTILSLCGFPTLSPDNSCTSLCVLSSSGSLTSLNCLYMSKSVFCHSFRSMSLFIHAPPPIALPHSHHPLSVFLLPLFRRGLLAVRWPDQDSSLATPGSD